MAKKPTIKSLTAENERLKEDLADVLNQLKKAEASQKTTKGRNETLKNELAEAQKIEEELGKIKKTHSFVSDLLLVRLELIENVLKGLNGVDSIKTRLLGWEKASIETILLFLDLDNKIELPEPALGEPFYLNQVPQEEVDQLLSYYSNKGEGLPTDLDPDSQASLLEQDIQALVGAASLEDPQEILEAVRLSGRRLGDKSQDLSSKTDQENLIRLTEMFNDKSRSLRNAIRTITDNEIKYSHWRRVIWAICALNERADSEQLVVKIKEMLKPLLNRNEEIATGSMDRIQAIESPQILKENFHFLIAIFNEKSRDFRRTLEENADHEKRLAELRATAQMVLASAISHNKDEEGTFSKLDLLCQIIITAFSSLPRE